MKLLTTIFVALFTLNAQANDACSEVKSILAKKKFSGVDQIERVGGINTFTGGTNRYELKITQMKKKMKNIYFAKAKRRAALITKNFVNEMRIFKLKSLTLSNGDYCIISSALADSDAMYQIAVDLDGVTLVVSELTESNPLINFKYHLTPMDM